MSLSGDLNALVIDAPVGRHFAQVHRHESTLHTAISLFVETGIRRRQPIVVVATPETMRAVLSGIEKNGVDPQPEIEAGRMRVLGAAETLARFMRGGMPSWSEFHRTITDELNATPAMATGGLRVYGEMVNLLWRSGQHAAAIRLEEFWNDLIKMHPFTLFCGYMLNASDGAAYDHPITDICRTHTDMVHRDDDDFAASIDAASRELFGVPMDDVILQSKVPLATTESGLPRGLRSMVWLKRAKPEMSASILERARAHRARAS